MTIRRKHSIGYFPIYLFSLLPFWIIYGISDCLFVLVFYVFKYRRQVVADNLKRSFPEKSESELQKIERAFFRFLIDVSLETIKMMSMSTQSIVQRMRISDWGPVHELNERKQSFFIVLGHWGNWEWAGSAFRQQTGIETNGIYHPLSNAFFEEIMLHTRSRFGVRLVPMRETLRVVLETKNTFNVTAFIADQTPTIENATWLEFLHQDTAVFVGTEKLARKLNYPVVYASLRRVKRGYYEQRFEWVTQNPELEAEGEITRKHMHLLEQNIRQMPETWLWSHRRWKLKRRTV